MAKQTTKPNVLVFLTEQQRSDCLSCAGHPIVRTPNVDRLAAEGMRFTQAYTTSPVCMPARSSLQSGLYPHNHGQWSNYDELSPKFPNMAKRLKDLDYRTSYIGKSHLYCSPRGRHLDEYQPFMRSLGWSDIQETTGPGGTVSTDSIVTDRWKELGVLEAHRADYEKRGKAKSCEGTWASPLPKGEHLDDFIGRTAVDYIKNYEREEPFFAFVGFGAAHGPLDPPAEWLAKYDPKNMNPATAPTEPPEWVPERAAQYQRSLQNNNRGLTPEQIGKYRAAYYAKISHLDYWVGQAMDELCRRGFGDNTWVVFTSDHGEMLGDKGRFSKSVFYEESVRVPLIVRRPNLATAGQTCDRLTSLVDIFPTLVDAAGGDLVETGFGKSLLPLLEDPKAPHHDAIFVEHRYRTMIRDEQFKMGVDDAGDVLKLYDMLEDPGEEINLVGKPGCEDIVDRLRDRTLNWLLATQTRPIRMRRHM